jgi:hypothetical protein
MHSEFQKYNPTRPLAWRRDRALEILDSGRHPSRSKDDKCVKAYSRFLIREHDASSREERDELFERNPALFDAHGFHVHPDVELRGLLEAMIVAGMTDQEIAKRLGCLPETVDWYEKLFFNVRDRLHAEAWMAKVIRGPRHIPRLNTDGSLTARGRATAIKLLAHWGGRLILDSAVRSLVPRLAHGPDSDTSAWFDESLVLRIKTLATIAVANVSELDPIELFRQHVKLITQKPESKSSKVDVERNIETFLDRLPKNLKAVMDIDVRRENSEMQ